MNGSSARSAHVPGDRRRWWLGVLLAPAAWSFVEGVGYVVSARTCAAGAPGDLRARITQLIICVVGLAVAVAGLRLARAEQQDLRDDAPAMATADSAIDGRSRFMAAAGIIASILFIGGIVLFGLSAVLVDACDRIRQ